MNILQLIPLDTKIIHMRLRWFDGFRRNGNSYYGGENMERNEIMIDGEVIEILTRELTLEEILALGLEKLDEHV